MQFKKPFKRKSYLIEFFVHILKPTFPYNPLNELQIITQCERKLTINREKKINVIWIYLYTVMRFDERENNDVLDVRSCPDH